MKDTKFEAVSTEELKKKAKLIKVVTGTLGAMLVLLFVLGIVTIKSTSTLFVVPLGLLPIVLINIGQLKQINKELDERSRK